VRHDLRCIAFCKTKKLCELVLKYCRDTLRNTGRGLQSSTFQLNLSALYVTGGARRGYVARIKGVFGGVWGV